MAKRKTILSLLASFFLCITAICFAACGDSKSITSITVGIAGVQNDSQNSLYIERDYDNTADLGNFVITATYSNNSQKSLSIDKLDVDVSFNDEASSLDKYLAEIQNGNLSIGNWKLVFKYEDISFTVDIDIIITDDNSAYTIKLNTATSQMGGKTLSNEDSMFFGTDGENISIDIYKDEQLQSNIAESSTYILLKSVDGAFEYYDVSSGLPTDLKTPAECYADNLLCEVSVNDWSTLKPGKYLICSKIKADANHNETYSAFQTITVEKAPFVVENDVVDTNNLANYAGLKFSWNFIQYRGYYYDVSLEDMIESRNSYINEGFSGDAISLVLCKNDLTNNYKEKITLTNIVDSNDDNSNSINKILHYGTFVFVPDDNGEVLFNASTDYQKVKVKFVPNQTYCDLYAESAPFDILVKVNSGQYTIQQAEAGDGFLSFDDNGQIKTNSFKIDLSYDPYELTYSAGINYAYDTAANKHVFNTSSAGNFSATFKFKGEHNNYFWQIPADFTPNGYTYTTQTINYNGLELITAITYNWSVSKLNLTDSSLGFNLSNANGNNNFELVDELGAMAVYLKAALEYNSTVNLTNQGVLFNWTVKPLNTTSENYVSTITGRLEDCANKDSNLFKRFIYTDASVDDNDYMLLAINIAFAGNENFEAYDNTFFIRIEKIQPCSSSNLAKTFSTYVDESTGMETIYYVYQEETDFSQFITNMPDSEYGTWTIRAIETGMLVEDMDMITNGSYELIFTANANMPYVKSATITFYFLDAEPTSTADFI